MIIFVCFSIKHSEENIIVDCEFATMTVDDYQEVYLLEECNENTIVFNGDGLIDVLSDIDISSDDYEVTISNNLPNFQLTTNSILVSQLSYKLLLKSR